MQCSRPAGQCSRVGILRVLAAGDPSGSPPFWTPKAFRYAYCCRGDPISLALRVVGGGEAGRCGEAHNLTDQTHNLDPPQMHGGGQQQMMGADGIPYASTPPPIPSTRWITTLSSKVNLPHAIDVRALFGA